MTKIHGDGIATEFVLRNFFSIWVLADDKHAQFRDKVKCQLLHDPTPSLSFSTPEASGIFGRAEKRALKSTKPPYLLASKRPKFILPPLLFLFFLYSSTVYLYKSISLELLIKTKR